VALHHDQGSGGGGDTISAGMRYLVSLVLLLSLAAGARAAEPASDQAKDHARKAIVAYNLGKYAEAAKEYEAVYELTLDANMLFNVAQSYRLAGEGEKAITTYRSFIRSAPGSEQRALAETKIRELEQQRASAPSTVAAPVAPPPPLPAAPAANPPSAEPLARQPDPGGAGMVSGSVPTDVLTITPAPEPATPPQSPFYKRWPFWTVVGVVVAGGVALGAVLATRGNDLRMPTTDFGTKGY
jgi:tetratricopeptide (TPR) repeat protein